jgi:hypothetical protein
VIWDYDAPPHTEIHTAQPFGSNRMWFIQNGDPAKFIVLNKATDVVEREFILPVKDPKSVHGQFRHARMTGAGGVSWRTWTSAARSSMTWTGRIACVVQR